MRTKLLILSIIIQASFLFSQEKNNPCGTEISQEFLKLYRTKTKTLKVNNKNISRKRKNIYKHAKIPLAIHIVRRTNGTDGLTSELLDLAMSDINEIYSSMNMSFYICNINYIDSDRIFESRFDHSDERLDKEYDILEVERRNFKNKLNVYFVPDNNGSAWTYYPSKNSKKQHILMKNFKIQNRKTFSHEIGHWFGLIHTHGPYNDRKTNELVDDPNCDKEGVGDEICDTPADPNTWLDDERLNCDQQFNNILTDSKGRQYSPLTDNIMSSIIKPCRQSFTPGQMDRIHSSYDNMLVERGYTLDACGIQLENRKSYKWSEGWTSTEFFEVNRKTYMLRAKEKGYGDSGKNVHIERINDDGSIGSRVKSYKWSEGWSIIEFFDINGKTYMLRAKEKGFGGSGNNVHIERINNDGSIGSRVDSYRWSEGWSSVEFFQINRKSYMLRAKEKGFGGSGNNVHIERINNDGSIGSRVDSYRWSEGWSSVEFFEVNRKLYMLRAKEKGFGGSGNNVHIERINDDGSIGSRVDSYRWTEGWTSYNFLNTGSENLMLRAKTKGYGNTGFNVHFESINNNGSIGSRAKSYKWTEGWDNYESFSLGNKSYLIRTKSKGIGNSGKNVHIDIVK